MRRPLPPIQEPLEELGQKLRRCRDGRQKMRLHLLVLIASGEVSTRLEAAERLAQHRNTIGRWLKSYVEGGLEQLLRIECAGAPSGVRRIPQSVLSDLNEQLQQAQGFSGYGEVHQWLEAETGQKLAYSSVHRWVRQHLKAKLKRPRPSHPKKTLPTVLPLPIDSDAA